MDQEIARVIISILVITGVSWTIISLAWFKREDWTTSHLLYRMGSHTPQLNTLLILLCYALACDALAIVNRWMVLVIIIGMYLLGHAQWPISCEEIRTGGEHVQ